MKKIYSKPEILFESFTMNTNIAADCEVTFRHYARNTCAIPGSAPGFSLFNDSDHGGACDIQGGEAETYNGFCYHVPVPEKNLFNS